MNNTAILICLIIAIGAFVIIQSIRLMVRGARIVAQFRKQYGREPTEREWRDLANRASREVFER